MHAHLDSEAGLIRVKDLMFNILEGAKVVCRHRAHDIFFILIKGNRELRRNDFVRWIQREAKVVFSHVSVLHVHVRGTHFSECQPAALLPLPEAVAVVEGA